MWDLKEVKVNRAGVTASSWKFETSRCSCGVDPDGLRFRFNIASKGGGRTDILLEIGPTDLPRIVGELCDQVPGAEELLLTALTEAVRRKRIAEQEKTKADEAAQLERDRLAGDAEKKLGKIQDYLSEQYMAKPVGEDEREKGLCDVADQIENALGVLRYST